MSLFLRGNVWWVELRDPATGKLIRETTRSKDREVAERIHDVRRSELLLAASGAASLPRERSRSWDEAAQRWLDETRHKRDHRGDQQKLAWLQQHLGGRKLRSLSRDDIMDVLRLKAREASPSTANRYLSLIRAILRRAANEWDWLDKVPNLRAFKEPPGRERWLRPDEIERLLEELPRHQRLMVVFALATGQRQGAIKRLTWDRVDIEKGFCWIDHSTSKTGKPICVPLNEDAIRVLREVQGQHPEYVFSWRGGPISEVNTRTWRSALKRAGISDFRWHDLRHTWASHHAMNGTPIDVLKELGGWSSLAMPMRYRHLSHGHLRSYSLNAPKLGSVLAGQSSGSFGAAAESRKGGGENPVEAEARQD